VTRNKLLLIYNICGIDCVEKIDWYIKCINSLLNQDLSDCRVIVSGCKSSKKIQERLRQTYDKTISYNFIDDVVPIIVSFNHTISKCVKYFGDFDGYLYCESGIDTTGQSGVVSKLYNLLISGPYGIVSGQPDNDIGFNYDATLPDLKSKHYIIPIGQAINGHFKIFSKKLREYYGHVWPDIFGGHCNESVLSFVCAALKLKWIIHNDAILHHELNIDKQSAGFCTHKWVANTGRPTWDHPFIIPSIINRLCTQENWEAGLGYEEARNIMIHKQDEFDEEGFCKNDRLKEVVKQKLFLQSNEFDYNKITYEFTP